MMMDNSFELSRRDYLFRIFQILSSGIHPHFIALVDKLKDQGYALYIGKELEQSDIFPVLRIFLQTEDKRLGAIVSLVCF